MVCVVCPPLLVVCVCACVCAVYVGVCARECVCVCASMAGAPLAGIAGKEYSIKRSIVAIAKGTERLYIYYVTNVTQYTMLPPLSPTTPPLCLSVCLSVCLCLCLSLSPSLSLT